MEACVKRIALVMILAASLMFGTPSLAKQDKAGAPPEAYAKVASCRQIVADADRLACFDAAMAAFDAALAKNEVYMVDKKQVRETRRSLFGLPLPSFGLFGDGKDDNEGEDAVTQIDSTIKHVTSNANGWLVTIKEGSAWQQTDSTTLGLSPKVGGTVTIKKGAMGSYKMNVGKQSAFKVKRVL
jgi:hypothetical protein